ncbi:DUF4333 domain-containing protein [Streptomyces xiaopingdaonensis]|uniref:DUF4333 domain-containing protein n=1 Tax=Streptomyces xiaopingdaonensis TaxID=1565415 RepID=UPI0002FA7000|nr:DUF4333 domain-containing protein [Streptomyces xiaopingdaonensis]
MKRIIVAGVVAVLLAGGVVLAWNVLDNTSVATARGTERMVPRAEVEQKAKENFARPFIEEAPKSVSCPRGLRAEEFDTVKCKAEFEDGTKSMLISTTEVKGDRVVFDYGVLEGESADDR